MGVTEDSRKMVYSGGLVGLWEGEGRSDGGVAVDAVDLESVVETNEVDLEAVAQSDLVVAACEWSRSSVWLGDPPCSIVPEWKSLFNALDLQSTMVTLKRAERAEDERMRENLRDWWFRWSAEMDRSFLGMLPRREWCFRDGNVDIGF